MAPLTLEDLRRELHLFDTAFKQTLPNLAVLLCQELCQEFPQLQESCKHSARHPNVETIATQEESCKHSAQHPDGLPVATHEETANEPYGQQGAATYEAANEADVHLNDQAGLNLEHLGNNLAVHGMSYRNSQASMLNNRSSQASMRRSLHNSISESSNLEEESGSNNRISTYWKRADSAWFSRQYNSVSTPQARRSRRGSCISTGSGRSKVSELSSSAGSAGRSAIRRGPIRLPSSRASGEAVIGQGMRGFIKSPYFDYISGILVLFNAALIGVQTDIMAKQITSDVPTPFRVCEVVFCAAFTVELSLRLFVHRMNYFRMADRMWNVFDFLLVVMQIIEELISFVIYRSQPKDAGGMSDLSMMRILRVLRLVRIIRLVRVLRLISELRTLVVSLAGSLRSLCWTILLLMLIMYVTGVYLTQVISDHRALLRKRNTEVVEEIQMEELMGSVPAAMLTLYQAITGGISWHKVTDLLIEHIHPWTASIVTFYIAFSLFALMNIVTGVFVESALANAKHDQDSFLLQFVLKIFEKADRGASGAITWSEFEACLAQPEMQMYCDAFGLDVEEAKNLFVLLDTEMSGQVEFDEFLNGCSRLRGPAKALDLALIGNGFKNLNEQFNSFAFRFEASIRLMNDGLDRFSISPSGCSNLRCPSRPSTRTVDDFCSECPEDDCTEDEVQLQGGASELPICHQCHFFLQTPSRNQQPSEAAGD